MFGDVTVPSGQEPLTHPKPLHQRAIERILVLMREERYGPGDQLPSENDLALDLGISRPTLREALLELQTQGVIERRRGVGTFLSAERPASLRPGIEVLKSFRTLSKAAGVEFAQTSWQVESGVADEEVAVALDAKLRDPIVSVLMAATASGTAAATFETFILPRYVDMDALTAYTGGSLLDFVVETKSPGLHLTNTELSAVAASGRFGERLDVPDGTPLLNLVEVFFDRSGQSVMYSRNHFLTNLVPFNLVRMVG